jgi:hypothetical protein
MPSPNIGMGVFFLALQLRYTLPAIMPVMVMPMMVAMPHHNHHGSRFSLLRRVNAGKHKQHCQSQ